MKCSLGISNFLEEISSFPFCCFPLFFCIDCWGRLSYLSLLFFGTLESDAYIFPFLLCFLLLFFTAICKTSSDSHFAFLPFFSMGMVLIPVSCTMSRTILVQFSSVAQSCPTLCDLMNHSMPGLPVHHQLQEFTKTHVHRVSDATQPSHPLSSPSPPAPNPSQHQSLFQWVSSSHEVAKVLEFQL